MSDWLDFARGLLAALGAPDSQNNEAAILTWMAGEQPPGSPNAAFNPLNIQAHGYPGEGGITGTSGSGQFNFADWQTGIQQTANFLSGSRYAGVVQSFRADAPAAQTLAAIQGSGWASGGYGGGLPGLLGSIMGNWAQYANGLIAGAAPGGSTTAGAGGTATATGLSIPGLTSDPLGSLKSILQDALTGLTRVGILLVGLGAGVALIVVGGYRAVAPIVKERTEKATEQAGKAAGVAKAAGAVAA